MVKTKISKEEINSIFQSSGGVKKEFVEKIKLKGLSEKYGNYLFYQTRKGLSTPKQLIPPEEPVSDKGITVIKSSDITPVVTTPNDESDDLKKAYKKLFEKETGEHIEDEPNKTYKAESPDDINEHMEEPSDKEYNANIRMAGILKQIGVAINNNILWKERTLNNDEILSIEQSAEDIELKLGDALATEDAPWYNYLIFTLAVPAMSRVDMIPMKLKQLSDWIANMKSNQNTHTNEAPTNEEEPVVVVAEQQYAGGISDAQKQWIDSLRAQGYDIESGFNPNKAVDYAALRDKKIARNK